MYWGTYTATEVGSRADSLAGALEGVAEKDGNCMGIVANVGNHYVAIVKDVWRRAGETGEEKTPALIEIDSLVKGCANVVPMDVGRMYGGPS